MSAFSLADTFFALRFLRLLTTPWKKTGAYKAGIIDDDGNVIKKAETSDEKKVYNLFHRLVFNLKRLLNKIPLGKTTLASYAAALYLIKEHTSLSDCLLGEILEETIGFNPNHHINSLNESYLLNETKCLNQGVYVLNENDLFLKNGDVVSSEKCHLVVNEYNSRPIGEIFGMKIFKIMDSYTHQHVIVTNYNLNKI